MQRKENKLRELLKTNKPTLATRINSTWPYITELAASSGVFDYIEFLAECGPFIVRDLENMVLAAERHSAGSIIKLDYQNRSYTMQKALAAGYDGILLCDHTSAEQVRESIHFIRPSEPGGGCFGHPGGRFDMDGTGGLGMADYRKMLNETVILVMIEKKQSLEQIDEILSVPGVDMVQFGPFDYCLSMGWDPGENREDAKAAERRMIEAAFKHGVQPRCEINTAAEAQYYYDLGIRHFCLGDEVGTHIRFFNTDGKSVRNLLGR
ncbi:2,4-dihydroxyhept-2-ene-1,7-dioic acid aldolase [Anaerotruncus sp. AF02-27]|jgi:2-keto-3-deoxy-L-rhamnonate aldolase RhmA|uniref:HpcH/HpaI aldolase family protein n=1 Tax=Anaerotruncus TaxID=244127 RepID=UPI000E474716|nr:MULTISPECIES: aldolase/citrate lyase family protein [Anaerotruncus]RGX54928.1 2,4-dihydroxyhept-2-ene-1,7-dioic acid aldolase [Anaerotruncus sp. AF02-27]